MPGAHHGDGAGDQATIPDGELAGHGGHPGAETDTIMPTVLLMVTADPVPHRVGVRMHVPEATTQETIVYQAEDIQLQDIRSRPLQLPATTAYTIAGKATVQPTLQAHTVGIRRITEDIQSIQADIV